MYLFQDQAGRVLYIGKAKNLRARVGSYFLAAAAGDQRTARLVREAYDIDFVEAESEVDALLMEARLVKDIQPKLNRDLRDDKSFPYLQITTHEDFPRVEVTREPQTSGVKLYGPFANAGSLRGAVQALQKVFKFRTCSLDIEADDERWRWFRPCLLASINQCTAPCNFRIGKEEYRNDIKRLRMFLEGNRKKLLDEMRAGDGGSLGQLAIRAGGPAARRNQNARKTAASAASSKRTNSPKCFSSIRRRASPGCRRSSSCRRGRGISRASILRTWAATKRWPAWCNFWMACRSSPAIGRFAFATSKASTITRAFAKWWPGVFASCASDGDVFPDVLLDRRRHRPTPPRDGSVRETRDRAAARSLARQEGRTGLRDGPQQAAAAEPAFVRLATAAIRPRRGPPLRPALSSHSAAQADARGVRP